MAVYKYTYNAFRVFDVIQRAGAEQHQVRALSDRDCSNGCVDSKVRRRAYSRGVNRHVRGESRLHKSREFIVNHFGPVVGAHEQPGAGVV